MVKSVVQTFNYNMKSNFKIQSLVNYNRIKTERAKLQGVLDDLGTRRFHGYLHYTFLRPSAFQELWIPHQWDQLFLFLLKQSLRLQSDGSKICLCFFMWRLWPWRLCESWLLALRRKEHAKNGPCFNSLTSLNLHVYSGA